MAPSTLENPTDVVICCYYCFFSLFSSFLSFPLTLTHYSNGWKDRGWGKAREKEREKKPSLICITSSSSRITELLIAIKERSAVRAQAKWELNWAWKREGIKEELRVSPSASYSPTVADISSRSNLASLATLSPFLCVFCAPVPNQSLFSILFLSFSFSLSISSILFHSSSSFFFTSFFSFSYVCVWLCVRVWVYVILLLDFYYYNWVALVLADTRPSEPVVQPAASSQPDNSPAVQAAFTLSLSLPLSLFLSLSLSLFLSNPNPVHLSVYSQWVKKRNQPSNDVIAFIVPQVWSLASSSSSSAAAATLFYSPTLGMYHQNQLLPSFALHFFHPPTR